jgi:hypothetical protein
MTEQEKIKEIKLLKKEIEEIKKLTEKAIKFLTTKKEESKILLEKLSKEQR